MLLGSMFGMLQDFKLLTHNTESEDFMLNHCFKADMKAFQR
jgi:hypothetical protein